ncbi:RNase T domain containing protein [Asbolus verrucosus]|uniref:RNase T domain containing protein n=1 Tax=Asbolus verrucosus TaxID=1661398 RepID=A0A482V7P9_ASBVE|nr:RNase T domain containing protein [Asbolus verrucosus]
MLPTKGYFQDIECPYFDNTCNRPYCHFRHRKKPQESTDDSTPEAVKEPEVPTYKPTPKSELANIKSHIPISYVPDLAFRPDRTIRPIPKFSFEKPTYKPTPLSILSSANKRENSLEDNEKESRDDIEAIREIKQNIANVEYNPEVSLQDEINFEDLSAEFDMIDDIIQEPNTKTLNISNNAKENDKLREKHEKSSNSLKDDHGKSKEKSSRDKTEKRSSSSSSKSHKSKHHKKDTKDKSKDENKDKPDKSKEKKIDKSKEKDKNSEHKSKHKSSKEKEKSNDKDRNKRKSSSKSKDRDKEKHKEKRSKESGRREKRQRTKSSDSKSSNDANNELLESNSLDNYSDIDFGDDEDTLSECYKIFKEYEAPKLENKELPPVDVTDETKEDVNINKKRIAHSSAHVSESGSKLQYIKPKIQMSAAQMMTNRLKLARLAQANNEQKNLMNGVKQITTKRPPPTLLEAARNYKLQKMATQQKSSESGNVIDSILNNSKVSLQHKPKKIAPVQNVNSIQRAKARIDELAKQKASETFNKTPAQTVKGAKRVAHVPDISLSDIPDVLNADKSKLPINVRTRFLTMIADECVKLYLTKEDAYARALNEEFSCYEKCKVLTTYKNSAMLAVNRLRKELQEREKLGLGPIGEGESSEKAKSSEFTGKKFYENIKQYVLTEEELDLHGYPRESTIPGHAVIKNPRSKAEPALGENQRKCCRCSKIYLVDEDGFVLYQEECVYHPLKKRTLRGEQMYLCCKSGDDAGCATSNTHVSKMSEGAELEGYQMTMEPEPGSDPRSCAVYALDCEMCYTIKGLELTRVTIVDSECKTVYESLVKPLNPIIDYNTTFSGITREQMERTSTSILQVQANILHLCNSKTILIGHSLESDMKALKIIHGTIIDTSVLFPHKMGLPHKRALKVLASEFLKKIIQNNVSGHDSAEDAIACMELVKWKVREELKIRGPK